MYASFDNAKKWQKPVAIVTNGEVEIYENGSKGIKSYRIPVAKTW